MKTSIIFLMSLLSFIAQAEKIENLDLNSVKCIKSTERVKCQALKDETSIQCNLRYEVETYDGKIIEVVVSATEETIRNTLFELGNKLLNLDTINTCRVPPVSNLE
jgi:hypothetical protein